MCVPLNTSMQSHDYQWYESAFETNTENTDTQTFLKIAAHIASHTTENKIMDVN